MAKNALKDKSLYAGSCIALTTKHAKSLAIAPAFLEKLDAQVFEYIVDTDKLGTFSGEITRQGTALECVRKKCAWPFTHLNTQIEYGLANEGSFGPHPLLPFLPCDYEILYFIDRKQNFHLHLSHVSEKTNYRMQSLDSLEALQKFANDTLFPSHALILRPNSKGINQPLFKGVASTIDLEAAFNECIKYSSDKKVWVETDMRAQYNPSRMKVIAELASKFADQLKNHCPRCASPGWGKVRQEKGLRCSQCGSATELVKSEIFGCVKCDYEENHNRFDHITEADPSHCPYCNP